VGAVVQMVYRDGCGPARAVRAGSGYWSQDSAVLVFGIPETPRAVRVRWPGGRMTETELRGRLREVVIRYDGTIVSVIE
jgi:hypothetical protein